MAWAYGTAWSAPSRSVRPTAPTSSEPPVSSSTGSSGPARVGHRVGHVLRRVAGRVERRSNRSRPTSNPVAVRQPGRCS